jgi:hypothetical protein
MRKQLQFLLLLWVFGCTLFFSCGALAAANPYTNYPSDDLGSTNVITDPSENLREPTGYDAFGETGEGGIALGGPPPLGSLVADFGAMGALCRYSPSSGWSQLATASPNLMVTTLYLGLVANFPAQGLYQYHGATWTLLTQNSSVENLLGMDLWVYAAFPSLGLWKFHDRDRKWINISYATPDKMQANGSNLLANFPGDGLYQYDGTTWTLLTQNSSVENLLGISGKVYADYGSLGLWKYDGEWHNLSYVNPDKMQAWGGTLVANFPGHGLYQYDGYTIWYQLTSNDTVQAFIAVGGNLYADYGTLGLWKYNSFFWTQIASADANLLGSYGENLVANFPGYGGLYQYSGSSWALLTSNSGVTNMVSATFP